MRCGAGHETIRLSVETPCPALRLLRVAGQLSPPAAARVLRLVDAQLRRTPADDGDLAALIIDLGEVSSFEPGGLESLRHAPYTAARRGISVYLCGCSNREHLLPVRARQVLTEFATFPTAEHAVQALTDPESMSTPDRATDIQATPLPP